MVSYTVQFSSTHSPLCPSSEKKVNKLCPTVTSSSSTHSLLYPSLQRRKEKTKTASYNDQLKFYSLSAVSLHAHSHRRKKSLYPTMTSLSSTHSPLCPSSQISNHTSRSQWEHTGLELQHKNIADIITCTHN